MREAGLNPLPVQQPIPVWFGLVGPDAHLARLRDVAATLGDLSGS